MELAFGSQEERIIKLASCFVKLDSRVLNSSEIVESTTTTQSFAEVHASEADGVARG